MNDDERKLLVEVHTDVKWLKDWAGEHKALHNKYTYFFVATAVAIIISFVV